MAQWKNGALGATTLKKLRQMLTPKGRERYGATVIEGPQAVREFLSYAGDAVIDVYLTERAQELHPDIAMIVDRWSGWAHEIPEEDAASVSPDTQGVIAVLRLDAFTAPARSAGDFVVLERMSDPGNLGTLIRTADAAGIQKIYVCEGSVDVWNPKVVRAGAGAHAHIEIETARLDDALASLRAQGARIAGADGYATTTLAEFIDGAVATPIAWVIGNEAHGLSGQARLACDATVSIPIFGQAESLNATIAAALCMYARYLRS